MKSFVSDGTVCCCCCVCLFFAFSSFLAIQFQFDLFFFWFGVNVSAQYLTLDSSPKSLRRTRPRPLLERLRTKLPGGLQGVMSHWHLRWKVRARKCWLVDTYIGLFFLGFFLIGRPDILASGDMGEVVKLISSRK